MYTTTLRVVVSFPTLRWVLRTHRNAHRARGRWPAMTATAKGGLSSALREPAILVEKKWRLKGGTITCAGNWGTDWGETDARSWFRHRRKSYVNCSSGTLALQSRSVRASTMRVRCDFGVKDTLRTCACRTLVLAVLAAYAQEEQVPLARTLREWQLRGIRDPTPLALQKYVLTRDFRRVRAYSCYSGQSFGAYSGLFIKWQNKTELTLHFTKHKYRPNRPKRAYSAIFGNSLKSTIKNESIGSF